jgi:hypothetical protein
MFHTWGVANLPILEMLGMESFDYSAVVDAPTFGRTTLINRAQAMHAAIGNRENRSACDATKQEDIWLSGFHTIAEESLPFLRPADATSLVATALPAECTANLSPGLKIWTELYRAVAARNAQGMVDAGEAALQEGNVEDGRLTYALSAAMLGHLAIGQPDRTLQLWRERPEPLQRLAASPGIELVIGVAEQRLADGVLVSQRPAAP